MTIHKHQFPILEYDTNPNAIINPDYQDLDIKLPKKCIFAFLVDHIDKFAKKNNLQIIASYPSVTKDFPVYLVEYKGEQMCLVQAPVGAPSSVQILDWLFAYGVEKVISAGCCGALVDIPENTFLIPNRALRDEGTSYKYLEPSRYIDLDSTALKAIEKTFDHLGMDYKEVMTWSTDAFYRETPAIVQYRIEEGCSVVEMECSALVAVAKVRKKTFGMILFTADSLANEEEYDQRSWGELGFATSLDICLEILLNM